MGESKAGAETRTYRSIAELEAANTHHQECRLDLTRKIVVLEAARGRFEGIILRAFGYLPTCEEPMALADLDIVPHVVQVADEFAILKEQVAALEAALAKEKARADGAEANERILRRIAEGLLGDELGLECMMKKERGDG